MRFFTRCRALWTLDPLELFSRLIIRFSPGSYENFDSGRSGTADVGQARVTLA